MSIQSNGNGGLGTNVGSVLEGALGAQPSEVNPIIPDRKVVFGPSCPNQRRPFRNNTHNHGYGEHGPRWDRASGPQVQQGKRQPVPEVFGSIVLDSVDRIELKLTFHEDAHCDLIPQRLRVDTAKVDKKALLGSQYVDRGTQPIKSNHTQVSLIRVGLANNGFRLVDARSYRKHEPDTKLRYYNRPKRCVVLEFRRDAGSIPLDSVTQDEVRALANLSWAECFVWDNTQVEPLPGYKPDRSVTVNCRGPERDMKPKRMIAIRDGAITSVPAVVES